MKSIWTTLATLGPVGYMRAPGTCASALTLIVVYVFNMLHISSSVYAATLTLALIAGWLIITKALRHLKRSDDPKEIVFDEVLGCLLTFFAVPINWLTLLIGFVLFRFFDIAKPFGIRSLEKIKGAWGILLDDLAAALYSAFALRLLLYFFHDYIL